MSVKDKRHPLQQNTDDAEAIYRKIVGTFRKWLALRPSGTEINYCEHGSYTGHHGALAYLCPVCNADGSLSFPSRRSTI